VGWGRSKHGGTRTVTSGFTKVRVSKIRGKNNHNKPFTTFTKKTQRLGEDYNQIKQSGMTAVPVHVRKREGKEVI